MTPESLAAQIFQEHPNDAVIVVDADATIIDWNEGAERIFGWKRDEVLGRTLGEIVPPLQYLGTDGSFEQAGAMLLREGVWRGDVLLPHRDGHLLAIDSSVQLLRNPDGLRCCLISINRDITEQTRRAAILRFQAPSMLIDEDGSVPTVIWRMMANHDFELVVANRAALDYLGNPTGDLEGLRASAVYGDQQAILSDLVRSVSQNHPFEREVRLARSSGQREAMRARFTFLAPDYVICHFKPAHGMTT